MSARTQEETEAIQAVVDRVSSYQDGAPENTVEEALRQGLSEAGLDLDETAISTLAAAVEDEHGRVDVGSVLTDD